MTIICAPLSVLLIAGIILSFVGTILSAIGLALVMSHHRRMNSYYSWVEKQMPCKKSSARSGEFVETLDKKKFPWMAQGVQAVDDAFTQVNKAFCDVDKAFEAVDAVLRRKGIQ